MRGEYKCGKCGVFREKVEHNCNDERRRPGTPEEPEEGHDNHTSESSEEGGDIPPPPTSSYPHNPAGGKHGLDRGQRGCGVAKSRILAAPVMAATAERDIDLWCPNCPYGNKRNARGAGRPRAPLCQGCSRGGGGGGGAHTAVGAAIGAPARQQDSGGVFEALKKAEPAAKKMDESSDHPFV